MKPNALKTLLMLGTACFSAETAFAQSAQSANNVGGTGFADVK
jgi:hypothetical protein